jgi:hypothetical protein
MELIFGVLKIIVVTWVSVLFLYMLGVITVWTFKDAKRCIEDWRGGR